MKFFLNSSFKFKFAAYKENSFQFFSNPLSNPLDRHSFSINKREDEKERIKELMEDDMKKGCGAA